ncbi:hypothetical protein FACS189413_06880 [Bacteroidia bacterium]|nr:hypothetical protein FACS189413_06880 [Bacteroidia bacterium]
MKTWQKTTLIVSIAIVITGTVFFSGIYGLTYTMINSKSCTYMNIDNIETRAPVSIPAVLHDEEYCSCIFDEKENSKTNYFRINTEEVEMVGYLERNFFKLIPADTNPDLSVFAKLKKSPNITTDNKQNYYYSFGERERTAWLAVVDQSNGDLWVHLQYKD